MKKKNKQMRTTGTLASDLGIRLSTIQYYAEIGILPYEQAGRGLIRRFDKARTLKRLREIKALKRKGKTISEIIAYFKT